MRKTIFLLTLTLTVSLNSCKKDIQKTESITVPATPVGSERVRELKGEFYYDNEAAVFKGKSYIYGVKRDLMAEELAKKTVPKKRNSYDMVPVTKKAVIQPNPAFEAGENVWEEQVVIKEIVEISEPTDDEIVKIESGS